MFHSKAKVVTRNVPEDFGKGCPAVYLVLNEEKTASHLKDIKWPQVLLCNPRNATGADPFTVRRNGRGMCCFELVTLPDTESWTDRGQASWSVLEIVLV